MSNQHVVGSAVPRKIRISQEFRIRNCRHAARRLLAVMTFISAVILLSCSSALSVSDQCNSERNKSVLNIGLAPTFSNESVALTQVIRQIGAPCSAQSPTLAYKALYEAVKKKDPECIKKLLAVGTIKLMEEYAEMQKKPLEKVLENGLTESTFAPDLPETRNEKITGNFAILEVMNARSGNWEPLPFAYEDGGWKLAIHTYFDGTMSPAGPTNPDHPGQLPPENKIILYRPYSNARYNYTFEYPHELLIERLEASNGDGTKFVSDDGRVLLLVFGARNLNGLSPVAGFTKSVKDLSYEDGRVVTYKKLVRNWFVISGRHNGNIFYSKTIYRGRTYVSFTIEYPIADRATYDPVTARIAKSFKR